MRPDQIHRLSDTSVVDDGCPDLGAVQIECDAEQHEAGASLRRVNDSVHSPEDSSGGCMTLIAAGGLGLVTGFVSSWFAQGTGFALGFLLPILVVICWRSWDKSRRRAARRAWIERNNQLQEAAAKRAAAQQKVEDQLRADERRRAAELAQRRKAEAEERRLALEAEERRQAQERAQRLAHHEQAWTVESDQLQAALEGGCDPSAGLDLLRRYGRYVAHQLQGAHGLRWEQPVQFFRTDCDVESLYTRRGHFDTDSSTSVTWITLWLDADGRVLYTYDREYFMNGRSYAESTGDPMEVGLNEIVLDHWPLGEWHETRSPDKYVGERSYRETQDPRRYSSGRLMTLLRDLLFDRAAKNISSQYG